MSEEFKIEKGIPIPGCGRPAKYPWDHMEIGDSFFIPGVTPRMAASRAQHRKKLGEKHTWRAVDGGSRIWRVK